MRQLQRSKAKKCVHLPPWKVTAAWPKWLTGRRKKAQLFPCKGATSNAVNAYPMPNRHGFFENICPNGQFVSAIQAGEYAVEQPNQARAEILDVSDWLAEMSEKSIT